MGLWFEFNQITYLSQTLRLFQLCIHILGVGRKGITILCPRHSSVLRTFHHSSRWLNRLSPSEYYDAFVSIQRGLFNTRDRAEHTRKRKTISHTFSAKSITQFEQYMYHNLQELVRQWTRISDTATKSGQAYADLDALSWFNFLAFDIIGDLVSL